MFQDQHDFFHQWADFIGSMNRPTDSSEVDNVGQNHARPDFWRSAEESYQALITHYERVLRPHNSASTPPQLDTFMGFDLKLQKMAEAYAELIIATNQLNSLNVEATAAAFNGTDLSTFTFDPTNPDSTAKWQRAVDESIVQMQRSNAYLSAKSDYVSCLTRFQQSYRSFVESCQEYNHTPTLTEFEDLSKAVQELKREIWALKKQRA
ncbi:MAG: hypothetical protein CMQ07_01520 [Gammaproteobacteria bacterium]|nr:hypothetical protein [Gammaproteobacteria bacterium]